MGRISRILAQPPPLGPPPLGYKPPSHVQPPERLRTEPRRVDLELYDRRLPIYEAAVRLIEYVVQKGTCSFEELDRFSKAIKEARFLFNEDIESYLRKLYNEAFTLPLGERKREVLV